MFVIFLFFFQSLSVWFKPQNHLVRFKKTSWKKNNNNYIKTIGHCHQLSTFKQFWKMT